MQLPAGKYYIGDLCYVLADNNNPETHFDWMKFVDWTFENDPAGREKEGVVDHQGMQFSFHCTAYGDGSYSDQFGNTYPVDAGMIGCVALKDIPSCTEEHLKRHGNIVEFPYVFCSHYEEEKGMIIFGHIEIPTDYDEEDGCWGEDYDEDYDEE